MQKGWGFNPGCFGFKIMKPRTMGCEWRFNHRWGVSLEYPSFTIILVVSVRLVHKSTKYQPLLARMIRWRFHLWIRWFNENRELKLISPMLCWGFHRSLVQLFGLARCCCGRFLSGYPIVVFLQFCRNSHVFPCLGDGKRWFSDRFAMCYGSHSPLKSMI